MRRVLLGIVIGLVVSVAGFVAAVWYEVHRAVSSEGKSIRVDVPNGQPFTVIAARLQSMGLVRHARPLVIYASVTRADRRIHKGAYTFSPDESPVDILRRLTEGDILRVAVTIPEGFNIWQIAGAFGIAGVDSVSLVEAFSDEATLTRRRIPAATLEGYLFPDTYRVAWEATPGDVVRQMLANLDATFSSDQMQQASQLGLTPHEILTLASIIEAEARLDSERTAISAVYHNRLRRGMRLEADPTVAYAMGGYRGRLLYKDLAIESPYNTYRNAGLPPGPICSPGDASIRAALYPDTAISALYFVARGDGSHIFSQTLSEHQRATRDARKGR